MTRPGIEPFLPCAPELVREVRLLAVGGHERFEREVWARLPEAAVPGVPPNPSYHNARHAAAGGDGGGAIFTAPPAGRGPVP